MDRLFTYLLSLLPILSLLSAQTIETDYDRYLLFHWKGALTSHSIQLKVFPQPALLAVNYQTAVVLFQKPISSDNIKEVITFTFTNAEYPVQAVEFSDLWYNTEYSYFFVFGSSISLTKSDFVNLYRSKKIQEFHFKTFGIALKPYSFTFGAASCASSGSETETFLQMHDENMAFFIHMGDLHYDDITKDDDRLYYEAYYKVFRSKTQKKFFENTPIFYIWDDHDFGPNDSNGKSPGKPAAHRTYHRFVPYGTLKNFLPGHDGGRFPSAITPNISPGFYQTFTATDNDYGIFQSFLVGRCLFIIADLRSFKDEYEGDILSNFQKAWVQNQLRFVDLNKNDVAAVFFVSTVTWIGDTWGDYPSTQREVTSWIKQYVKENGIEMFVIAGDAHMIAFDDGSNNDHGGFPVIQSASIARCFSCKGGPYSHGTWPGGDQYGVVTVEDNGTKVCLKIKLKRKGKVMIEYDTCNPQAYPRHEMSCMDAYIKMFQPSIVIASVFGGALIVILLLHVKNIVDISFRSILTRAYKLKGLDDLEIAQRIKYDKEERQALKKRKKLSGL